MDQGSILPWEWRVVDLYGVSDLAPSAYDALRLKAQILVYGKKGGVFGEQRQWLHLLGSGVPDAAVPQRSRWRRTMLRMWLDILELGHRYTCARIGPQLERTKAVFAVCPVDGYLKVETVRKPSTPERRRKNGATVQTDGLGTR
ncbi:hypothetical protein NLJ89_g4458 [Agrocybe chaxingu]|uniref:Uncharacterized protein n=1 Tax=Agrocybe chaxingu TaxID=84603 RepID=A0A9W8MVY6_9AGAR|nr:hypothetical protein NLJ89_g4458 [Agrocybe chaxingu]